MRTFQARERHTSLGWYSTVCSRTQLVSGSFRPEDLAINEQCQKLQQHWHQCPAEIRYPNQVAPKQLPRSKPT